MRSYIYLKVTINLLMLPRTLLRIFAQKLGRKNENRLNGYIIKKHEKRPTYNDLIIAYASMYKARLNYLYIKCK
jgi:hypothetical protein